MVAQQLELLTPGLVSLLLTNRCNLRCRHCISSSGEAFEGELSDEELLDLVDQCGRMNVFFIDFNGGEPFVHPLLGELVQRAHGHGIRCVVTSNGTLITDDWLERFGRFVFMFRLSLDSDDQAAHDDFRGVEGCWQKTTDAILRLRSRGHNVTAITCVQRHNLHRIEHIYRLACELGANALSLILLLPAGRGSDLEPWVLEPEEVKSLCMDVRLLREEARLARQPVVILEECSQSMLLDPDAYDAGAQRICGAATWEMSVTPTGVALPCSSYTGVPPDPELSVRAHSLLDIWRNASFFKVVRDRMDIEEPCGQCDHFDLCFGGCRAAAYHWKATHTAADPTCWVKSTSEGEHAGTAL